MAPFTSKELYIMNGGNKQYIGRDGFMDIYSATAAEEAEWAKEIIAAALLRLDTENNTVQLLAAIDNLLFHRYQGLEALLLIKLKTAGPLRQIAIATALWNVYKYPQSAEIIIDNLASHREECLKEAFLALAHFKKHASARKFLDDCLQGSDEIVKEKAGIVIQQWAYRP